VLQCYLKIYPAIILAISRGDQNVYRQMDIINFTDTVSLVSNVCHCSTAQLIIRPQYVDAAYCYRWSSVVCPSVVCLSQTAERIEVSFTVWTQVGPRNHVLHGVEIPHARGNFDRENIICVANG